MSEIKLLQGDCLELMKQIPDKSVDMLLTDPPYFILPHGKNSDEFTWDNFSSMESFLDFTRKWFDLLRKKLKDNSFMFIFWSQKYLQQGFEVFHPNRLLIWQHNNLVFVSSGDFSYDYEPIFVVKTGNPKLINGKHSCIFNFTKPQSNFKCDRLFHPTQKPLKLIEKIIDMSTCENETVLDCFMGSGTTGVACKELNRNFIGIELNKEYFDIAKQRIENGFVQKNITDDELNSLPLIL